MHGGGGIVRRDQGTRPFICSLSPFPELTLGAEELGRVVARLLVHRGCAHGIQGALLGRDSVDLVDRETAVGHEGALLAAGSDA